MALANIELLVVNEIIVFYLKAVDVVPYANLTLCSSVRELLMLFMYTYSVVALKVVHWMYAQDCHDESTHEIW